MGRTLEASGTARCACGEEASPVSHVVHEPNPEKSSDPDLNGGLAQMLGRRHCGEPVKMNILPTQIDRVVERCAVRDGPSAAELSVIVPCVCTCVLITCQGDENGGSVARGA
jgi:hypothetical protein